MTHPDGQDIGRLLTAAVPPMPAPPDRLAAVAQRVRRARLRRTLVTAACVALVLIGTPAVLAANRLGQVDPPVATAAPIATSPPVDVPCPKTIPRFGPSRSKPGALAPEGAQRAVMCRYDSNFPGPQEPGRVLTRDLPGFINVLNALPIEPPFDACFASGGGGFLTLEYPNGAKATLEFSDRCGLIRYDGRYRYLGYTASVAFNDRYYQQQIGAATAPGVPPAECAARLTPVAGRLDPEPLDDGGPPLSPAVVLTACRYVQDTGSLRRAEQFVFRSRVGEATDAVRAADDSGAPAGQCATTVPDQIVDVLILRDSSGRNTELRLRRDACPAVTLGRTRTVLPPAVLAALLDQLVGPVDWSAAPDPPRR